MKVMLLSIVLFAAIHTSGQNFENCQKIGYADTRYIVRNLPEVGVVESELKSMLGQYEKQLAIKDEDYVAKLKIYQENKLTDDERVRSEAELNKLRQSIEDFVRDSEASFRKRQEQLMAPIYLKIGKSISEVAVENKFSAIINTESMAGEKILLFFDTKFDVSPLVLKKLGVSVNQHKRP